MKLKIVALLIVLLAVIFLVKKCAFSTEKSAGQESATNEKGKPVYWIDPMNPMIRYNKPGLSSMGMKLVPVYSDNEGATTNGKITVRIAPEIVDNLGVRTAPVRKGTLARKIDTVGYVTSNENLISNINAYVDGWIRNLVVKTTEAPVTKGQLLMQLYSRTLVNAEEEYLIALETKESTLIDASQQKLISLGMAETQIQQLKKTRKASQLVDIYSPQNGIVATLNVREGMRITPEMKMMSIIDLSTIWIIVEVFEQQASWLKVGQLAEAQFPAFPGKAWKGRIDYVYPQLNLKTRTLKVRLRFDNPDNHLKPNMYALVTLSLTPLEQVLSIPKEAIIQTGEGARVIISLGKGRFQVQPVVTGIESGDRIEILSGLKKGDDVVSSGEFLIDSEASLKASLQRMNDKQSKKGKMNVH
ncbi:efflux RND transporter periplasmic adaptor subunit [Legionella maioricensis]|uniref:Efflux RND transporter periplasmic adaptor subunit n=1 Tax=Legionella maioricensis TaxID=2896528 RepID=A0A9X2CXZ6_9GAMM|nr:efflux RND transporter periplasmic adaptor subunit [Legionella maioricensis]MCL9682858.1 efflux RND transporter periplasmic adaptor subunit [Legionella maioricensis]MCL9686514.1 efflux RND transporter periplasmic adaptor subunit [Legionella maioricensis]